MVWEYGIVGGGDDCVLSKNVIYLCFKILVNILLVVGYVIVVLDYEGLGILGVYFYLNLFSVVNLVIVVVKVVKEYYGI